MILKKTTMISQARKPRKHKQNTGRTTKTTENNTNTKIGKSYFGHPETTIRKNGPSRKTHSSYISYGQ
jgi:hypothetical protein